MYNKDTYISVRQWLCSVLLLQCYHSGNMLEQCSVVHRSLSAKESISNLYDPDEGLVNPKPAGIDPPPPPPTIQ